MRISIYRAFSDFVGKFLRREKNTTTKYLKNFVKVVFSILSNEYLRSPSDNNIDRLLVIRERARFLRMLGCIDCMH